MRKIVAGCMGIILVAAVCRGQATTGASAPQGGTNAVADVPAKDPKVLVAQLKSIYMADRVAAAESLAKLGPGLKACVPDLLALFDQPNWQTQLCAADLLGKLGKDGTDAVPGITDVLGKTVTRMDLGLFQLLVDTLGKIGPEAVKAAVPSALAAIKSGRDDFVRAGCTMVAKNGDDAQKKQAVAALVELLKKKETFGMAVALLGEYGAAAKDAVPELVAELQKGVDAADWTGVRNLSDTLAKLGPDGKQAGTPVLLKAFAKLDAKTMDETGGILSGWGPDVQKQMVPVIVPAIKSDDAGVQGQALRFVAAIGAEAKDAAPFVTELLTGAVAKTNLNLVGQTASILSTFGPDAGAAAGAALLDALKAENEQTVPAYGQALLKAAPSKKKDAVPILIGHLKSQKAAVVQKACELLGEIGPDAESAVTALKAVAETHADANAKKLAGDAIAKIQPPPPSEKK